MTKRNNHLADFKAKVALEAIREKIDGVYLSPAVVCLQTKDGGGGPD